MDVVRHKMRLKNLRKEWRGTWEEYSREARKEAGLELLKLYQEGMSLTELGELWGTSDRKTITDLLELTGGYKRRTYVKAAEKERTKKELEEVATRKEWLEGKTYTIETASDGATTIIVPEVEAVPWSEQAEAMDPVSGEARATWQGGLFTGGDHKMQAELLNGDILRGVLG